MKAIRFFSILMIFGMFYSNNLTAQQEVLDGIYVKEHHPAKRVIPYTPLREADVMWLKRIWRVLDLREKINHPLYYPVEKIIDNKCDFNYTKGNPIQPGIWDGERGGSIYFQDPSYGLKSRLRKVKEPTAYNLDAYYTYPVSGLLIVFPSYLIHTVTPFKENLQRLSISFTANYGTS